MLDPLDTQIEKSLVSGQGIIFLLFAGREASVIGIVKNVVPIIVKNKTTVYQYISDLKKKKLIKDVKTIGGNIGQPEKILIANLDPIYKTIANCRLSYLSDKPPYFSELNKNEQRQMKKLFNNLNGTLNGFPEYLRLVSFTGRVTNEKEWRRFLKQLGWNEILSYFFEFCRETILECWRIKRGIVSYKDIDSVAIRYKKNGNGDYVWIEPYEETLDKFIKGKEKFQIGEISLIRVHYPLYLIKNKLDEEKIKDLANLTKGEGDIDKDTFVSELFFISLALRVPHLVGLVRKFRDRALRCKRSF